MSKKSIFIITTLLAVLSVAAFAYHQSTHWQYMAYRYMEEVDLSLYQHRGVVTTNPESNKIEAGLATVDRMFADGQSLKALGYCHSLLEEDPGNIELLLRAGIFYMQAEKYDLALEYFVPVYDDKETAFGLDGAWFLALIEARLGNPQKAKSYLEEVVADRGNYHQEAQQLLQEMKEL